MTGKDERGPLVPKTNEQRLAVAVEVIREVLDDFHVDHNWAYWAERKLALALHQADGCLVYRKDCPFCVAALESSAEETEQRAELRKILAAVYTPEGIEIWLTHAERQGWSHEESLQRALNAADGSFS